MIDAYDRIPLLPERKPAPTPVVVVVSRQTPAAPKRAAVTKPPMAPKKGRGTAKATAERWERLRDLYLSNPGRYGLSELGRRVGLRDHSSVLYALRTMGIYDPAARSEFRQREQQRRDQMHVRYEAEEKAKREQARIDRILNPGPPRVSRSERYVRGREKAAQIKAMLLQGLRQCEIARHLNLSTKTVWNVAAGKVYKTVEPARNPGEVAL